MAKPRTRNLDIYRILSVSVQRISSTDTSCRETTSREEGRKEGRKEGRDCLDVRCSCFAVLGIHANITLGRTTTTRSTPPPMYVRTQAKWVYTLYLYIYTHLLPLPRYAAGPAEDRLGHGGRFRLKKYI